MIYNGPYIQYYIKIGGKYIFLKEVYIVVYIENE